MLQVYKINMYVYAENETDAQQLESSLKDFVKTKREQGIAVTAKRLETAIKAFGNNPLLLNYLK